MIKAFLRDEKAQGMTEYILLVFLIALVAYIGVQMFGGKVNQSFEHATSKLDDATPN